MKTHLSHILPWKILLKNYYINLSDCLILPVCNCDKMHIIKKSDELKIQNRKYITDEQICRDINCKEKGEKKFYKNQHKIKLSIKSISQQQNNSYFSKECKIRHIKIFWKEYSKTINTFANDYLKKLKKIKKNNIQNTDEYLINKVKEYYVLDKDATYKYNKESMEKRIHKPRLNSYGSVSQYEFVYALISSGEDNDIIYLLNEIDKYKKNNKKGLSMFDVISEWGTQSFGRYANYIMENMNTLYLTINIIIESGNLYNKEVWEKLNKMDIYLFGDFHSFVPKWLHEHFYINKLKEYNNTLSNINLIDCIKVYELYDLLKKIFRYNYIWLVLLKYANDKQIKSKGYSIFLKMDELGYCDDEDNYNSDGLEY